MGKARDIANRILRCTAKWAIRGLLLLVALWVLLFVAMWVDRLWPYASMVVESQYVDERSVTFRDSLTVVVPEGWVVVGDEVRLPNVKGDAKMISDGVPMPTMFLRIGGSAQTIRFMELTESVDWPGASPWQVFEIGPVAGKVQVERSPGQTGNVLCVQLDVLERNLGVFFVGSEDNWEVWSAVLKNGTWQDNPGSVDEQPANNHGLPPSEPPGIVTRPQGGEH